MGTKRTNKGLNALNDRISELPDEVLSMTLLLLPLKEVVRTSILSRRWRFRWKSYLEFCSTLCLDVISMNGVDYPENMFGSIDHHGFVSMNSSLLSSERHKFVEWVDKILQLDYRPVMDTFRLRYHFEKEFSDHIDQWISMAILKRVQHFDIDLSHFHKWGMRSPGVDLYTFPHWLFTQEAACLVKHLYLKCCILVPPLDFSGFSLSSLLDLQLDHVLIDENCFAGFLSNCPNLEKLCLVHCSKLVSLNISGSFLKLKYLAVVGCYSLQSVVIAAKNLARFEYHGVLADFSLRNVHQLSDVFFRSNSVVHSATINCYVLEKFCTIPNVESLMLSVNPSKRAKIPGKFTNLKKLVLLVDGSEGTLWRLVPFFHAFPCLETLELNWWLVKVEGCKKVLQMKALGSSLCNLKDIIISGFFGSAHEIEFTAYLLNSAPALKKLTVYYKSRKNYCYKNGAYFYKVRREETAAEQAKQHLLSVVPPQVEFIFL
ncbi:hypothetical protein ACHQM5_011947 [Ranunculus cassubicifolius]